MSNLPGEVIILNFNHILGLKWICLSLQDFIIEFCLCLNADVSQKMDSAFFSQKQLFLNLTCYEKYKYKICRPDQIMPSRVAM